MRSPRLRRRTLAGSTGPLVLTAEPPTPPVRNTAARWIAVAGIGGQAGTTTVATLLCAVFAAHRRYRIVGVDADPTGGALGVRLAAPGTATVSEVASAAPDLTSFNRLAPYLDQTAEGSWAVVGRSSTPPDLTQCRTAMTALAPFFAVGVVDCGAVGQPAADGLLAAVHAPLIVAPVTTEGVLGAAAALDHLSARGSGDGSVQSSWHCGVVLMSTTQRPDTDVGVAARLLTARGGRVVPMPYDPGLTTSGRISPTSVSDGVFAAARRLATELLSRSARSGHNAH